MANEESPLILALPPESDYLTYLTIVEYNLTLENLPILHKVLQDETLTTNIGWDLVHLLVPYLPESADCLHDIARLGNPREVILKVTESLRLIGYGNSEDTDQDGEDDGRHPANISYETNQNDARSRADSSTYPLKTAPVANKQRSAETQAVEVPPPIPLPTNQFITLLSMLATLHSRIKTKYPSRFLSTTLQAILASFSNATSHREELILSVAHFVKSLTGSKRPPLPGRKSSSMHGAFAATRTDAPAQDPEATAEISSGPEDHALQRKLLQSFITHLLDEYISKLEWSEEDVPGMSWCCRIMEKMHADRIISGKKTFVERFAEEERLHKRIDTLGQLIALARELNITDEDLLSAAFTAEKVTPFSSIDEEDPPNSPEEVSLDRIGSFLLYTARRASKLLHDSSGSTEGQPFAIFPHHRQILKSCLAGAETETGMLGTEPEGIVDALLTLGILCLENDAIGEPETDEEFNEYLQVTALISSNCPSPSLRGYAHYLTSSVLRSHPDENVRLGFIRDTLEHCPFENLKVSAVGWIKGETIEANPQSLPDSAHHPAETADEDTSIFRTPLALDSLAPFLFPSLEIDLITAPISEAYLTFRTNLSFYLASLNFLFLLLRASYLHVNLDISDLWTNNDVAGSFLQPLRDGRGRYAKALAEGGELSEQSTTETEAELNLLHEVLNKVTDATAFLS